MYSSKREEEISSVVRWIALRIIGATIIFSLNLYS